MKKTLIITLIIIIIILVGFLAFYYLKPEEEIDTDTNGVNGVEDVSFPGITPGDSLEEIEEDLDSLIIDLDEIDELEFELENL